MPVGAARITAPQSIERTDMTLKKFVARNLARADADDAAAELVHLNATGAMSVTDFAKMVREVRLQRRVERLLEAGASERACDEYLKEFFGCFERAAVELEADRLRRTFAVIDGAART